MSTESCGDSTFTGIDLERERRFSSIGKWMSSKLIQPTPVTADMPGISRDELSVTIDKNVLTISAEPKDEVSQKERKVLRHERYSGKYARSLRLGEDIDEDQVSAEYRDGVLRLAIPKKAAVAPRQVDVKIN